MRLAFLSSVSVFALLACGGVSESNPDAAPEVDAPVDPCETNTCECEVDDDCGEFEVCDTVTTPGRICVCGPAYEEAGGACAFAGAPGDPGFQAEDVWTPSNAARATISTVAAGSIDTGVGTISPDGVCVFDSFSQTFTMPARDRSEVFAVDVSYFSDFVNGFGFGGASPALIINGAWNTLPEQQGGFNSGTFCLGEAGYGGDIDFQLTVAGESESCAATPEALLRFDRFSIRKAVAGECPDDVGEAINGDMEGNNGWTFAVGTTGTAAFAENIGAGNSRGIRLTRTTTASRASATTKISIPSAATVPDSAIEVFTAGTGSAVFEVLLGGQPVTRLVPNGLRRICVPDWAKGTVQDVTFALQTVMTSGAPINRAETVDLDAVSIVSDAGCGDDATQYGNDFETFLNSNGLAPGWAVTTGGVNGTEAPAVVLNSPNNANNGNGSVRMTATNFCNTALARRDITVPDSDGNNGPAVKAFVNIPNSPNGRGGLRYARAPFRFVEVLGVEGAGYQEVTLCIPPKFSGRRVQLEVFGTGGGGGCSNFPQIENTFVDDVSITTDATCAAN